MKIFKELREFALKGNVIDMAVGIVIGSAFTSVVNSLVKDIFTPVIGLLTTGVNFSNYFIVLKAGRQNGPYASLAAAQADAALTLNAGLFLNALISFGIVATALFFAVKAANRLKRPAAAPQEQIRECPRCLSPISPRATRCPQCTSELQGTGS